MKDAAAKTKHDSEDRQVSTAQVSRSLERRRISPRVSVALSALEVANCIRERLGCLFRRVARSGRSEEIPRAGRSFFSGGEMS